MPKPNIKPVYLLSDVHVADASDDADKAMPRKFSGIGNSGKPFMHWGERVIVDLSDITYKHKTPALLNHDRDKNVGFGELSTPNYQLKINSLSHLCGVRRGFSEQLVRSV